MNTASLNSEPRDDRKPVNLIRFIMKPSNHDIVPFFPIGKREPQGTGIKSWWVQWHSQILSDMRYLLVSLFRFQWRNGALGINQDTGSRRHIMIITYSEESFLLQFCSHICRRLLIAMNPQYIPLTDPCNNEEHPAI